jgi:hypothetical protein
MLAALFLFGLLVGVVIGIRYCGFRDHRHLTRNQLCPVCGRRTRKSRKTAVPSDGHVGAE